MTGGKRASRLLALAVIVLVHIGAIVVLLVRRDPPPPRRPVAAMVVRSVPAPPATTPEIATAPVALSIAPPVLEVDDPPPVAPSSACDVAAAVGTALGRDPAAVATLLPIAADPHRAVMLWDGRWRDAGDADPLRRAITAAIRGSTGDCLDESQTGPRLMIVPVAGSVVTVAVGSGRWTWRALLSPDRLPDDPSGVVSPQPNK